MMSALSQADQTQLVYQVWRKSMNHLSCLEEIYELFIMSGGNL